MEGSASSKLPNQSIVYLLMCLGGLLAFCAVGIYPSQRTIKDIDIEISRAGDQLEGQRLLYPLHKSLTEKMKQPLPEGMSFPARSPLPQDQIFNIPALLGEIVRKSSLQPVTVTPDVKSMADNSRLMSVQAALKGDFFNFRKFLFELLQLPYLEHVEEIRIEEASGGKEFRLKIWLSISER